MTWKGLASGGADQLQAAHDSTVRQLGVPVVFKTETRVRRPGEGFLSKQPATVGPVQCYVYWDGNAKTARGAQGDDAGAQDRNPTWSCAFLSTDGLSIAPLASGDQPRGIWEFEHPVYGRMRLDRVLPMQYQGKIVGYQAGAVRIG